MDPFLARLLWATLVALGIGSVLGVLLPALGRRRREDEVAAYAGSLSRMLTGDPDDSEEPGSAASLQRGAELRRRGDLAAAIRVHEKLLASPGLDPAGRHAAAVELARDFRSAGLLARAIEALLSVVTEDAGNREALRLLRELHEERGDWSGAAAAEEKRIDLGAGDASLASHLRARAARAHLAAGRLAEAGAEAGRATALSGNADALLAQAEVDLAAGRTAAALSGVAAALAQKPEALSLVYPRLEAAFDARPEGLGLFLAGELTRRPDDVLVRLALARHLRHRGQAEAAARELKALLAAHPSLLEARGELAAIALEKGTAEDLRAQLAGLLDGLSARRHAFRCEQCKLELDTFEFRCSMCGSWDTVKSVPHR